MTRQQCFIAASLCGYISWNLFFLLEKKVPDSIFKMVTGLPCPTTGGVRSLAALARGDWRQSLLFNPFTLVFIFLSLASLVRVIRCFARKEKILLSRWLSVGWLLSLSMAWIAKFAIGPAYW